MDRNISQNLRDAVDAEYLRLFPKQPFVPGQSAVTVSGKTFDREEFLLMTQSVMDGWWTEGHFTKQFEDEFASYMQRPFCATTNSGSSANLLALTALTSVKLGDRRLKPGDEVISVAASFPTTVTPILQLGCVPVFVDIELPGYNINIDRMKEALSDKTRAVMVAHTLGNPFPAKEIQEFCKENGLWFIEDCCDAIGGTYKGQQIGTFGDISTVSFYPAHHITMGEGGALLTSDGTLNKCIRAFRDWGRDCWCAPGFDNTCGIRFEWKLGTLPKGYDHKYIYSEVGYNLKITDTQAALGLAQLKKLPGFIEKRKHNHLMLREGLKPLSSVFVLPEPTPDSDPSWFGFLITIADAARFTRAELVNFLQTKRIATRYLFAGNILRQPVFTTYKPEHRVVGDLTVSDVVTERTLWIGCHPGLTDEMLTYVIACFKEFVEAHG